MNRRELIEFLAARAHDAYVAGRIADGRTSVPSSHKTGELLRPYDELAEKDKEDDRRTVAAVLAGLADIPVGELLAVLVELRVEARACDPVPGDLAGRAATTALTADQVARAYPHDGGHVVAPGSEPGE